MYVGRRVAGLHLGTYCVARHGQLPAVDKCSLASHSPGEVAPCCNCRQQLGWEVASIKPAAVSTGTAACNRHWTWSTVTPGKWCRLPSAAEQQHRSVRCRSHQLLCLLLSPDRWRFDPDSSPSKRPLCGWQQPWQQPLQWMPFIVKMPQRQPTSCVHDRASRVSPREICCASTGLSAHNLPGERKSGRRSVPASQARGARTRPEEGFILIGSNHHTASTTICCSHCHSSRVSRAPSRRCW
jgi:hypothetical protein